MNTTSKAKLTWIIVRLLLATPFVLVTWFFALLVKLMVRDIVAVHVHYVPQCQRNRDIWGGYMVTLKEHEHPPFCDCKS